MNNACFNDSKKAETTKMRPSKVEGKVQEADTVDAS